MYTYRILLEQKMRTENVISIIILQYSNENVHTCTNTIVICFCFCLPVPFPLFAKTILESTKNRVTLIN